VSAKRYRYTGKERDEETGMHYYGARYYAAWLGRWTSADPAWLVDGPGMRPDDSRAGRPGGSPAPRRDTLVDLYGFVRDNPISRTDPDGNEDIPVSDPVFARIATAPVPVGTLPSNINVPGALELRAQETFKASFRNVNGAQVAMERPGIVAKTEKGVFQYRPGDPGGSEGSNVNRSDAKASETLSVAFHTHPYDSGADDPYLSRKDLLTFAENREVVAFVRSARTEVALVRTEEFNKLVAKQGLTKVQAQIRETYDSAYKQAHDQAYQTALAEQVAKNPEAAKANTPAAYAAGRVAEGVGLVRGSEAANRAVAEKFHLGLYVGSGGALARVSPKDQR
jgi:RHS repeat-associated protein